MNARLILQNIRYMIVRFRQRWLLFVIAVLLVCTSAAGSILYAQFIAYRSATFWAIDVGQGDALLVRTRHGQTILVDGGPDPHILRQLNAILGPFHRSLDLVILTHPHQDHIGGLVNVLERYSVKSVLWTGVEFDNPTYQQWRSIVASRPQMQSTLAREGQEIPIDGGVIHVLWPSELLSGRHAPPEGPEGSGGINDTSVVVEISVDHRSLLLMGDASSVVERELLNQGAIHPVDIVKVGHHGSRFSSDEQFIAAVHPAVAIISAGLHNDYNQPAQSVIARFRRYGSTVYQTLLNGTIRIDLGSTDIVVKTDR